MLEYSQGGYFIKLGGGAIVEIFLPQVKTELYYIPPIKYIIKPFELKSYVIVP